MFKEIGMDFDELSELYKTNPEKFKELRQQMLDKLIMSSDNPERARAMQWELDQRMDQQPNDYASLIYFQERMHESLLKLRDALNTANGKEL